MLLVVVVVVAVVAVVAVVVLLLAQAHAMVEDSRNVKWDLHGKDLT